MYNKLFLFLPELFSVLLTNLAKFRRMHDAGSVFLSRYWSELSQYSLVDSGIMYLFQSINIPLYRDMHATVIFVTVCLEKIVDVGLTYRAMCFHARYSFLPCSNEGTTK